MHVRRHRCTQARIIKTMLKLQCGNGLMHESVSVSNLNSCTRPVFEVRRGGREGLAPSDAPRASAALAWT